MISACGLALVLLMDVSGSVSQDRYEVQRDGLAAAFQDEDVKTALLSNGATALEVVLWAGGRSKVLPWTVIKSEADISAVAQKASTFARSHDVPPMEGGESRSDMTAMGDAMKEAVIDLDHVPCQAGRMVIDVSGDGRNNSGWEIPNTQRDLAASKGIQINGLPIEGAEDDIVRYYRENVITTDGFIVVSHSASDFAGAIRRKLVQEIASLPASHSTGG